MIKKSGIRLILTLAIVAVAGSAIYYFREPLLPQFRSFWQRLGFAVQTGISSFTPPCSKPIYYSLGSVDARFQVSQEDLLAVLQQASDVWSKPLNKDLFAYAADGALKIDLVYDYRQEATDKLKQLGIVVTDSQKSYDDLKIKYDILNRQYQEQKSQLASMTASLRQQQAAYEAEVEKWNRRGGVPEAEYIRLNSVKDLLNRQVDQINQLSAQLNESVDNLNAEGTVLNKLIEQLNLDVARYNNVGVRSGEEFQEGLYMEGPQGKSITVFEFNSRDQLVRLLAHEMGHALGLEHTSNAGDIMYYLNAGKNEVLTAGDLAALKLKCAIK